MRHGITRWNELGRIQGRRDVPLSAAGRSALAPRRVPPPWSEGRCFSSPLTRAVQTAALLSSIPPETVPALAEMDWGEWEGATLSALRARFGPAFTDNAARGLDFRPPGGESPRDVMQRLGGWFDGLPADIVATVFTHKGVIRAALALATGWDMGDDFPERVDYAAGHAFVYRGGALNLEALNLPLMGNVR